MTISRETLLAALDHEQQALQQQLSQIDDQQWSAVVREDGWSIHDIVGHVADSTYGLALITLGEIAPQLPVDPTTGWMNPDELNQIRRQKNAGLSREKIMNRLASSFDHARRAISNIDDYSAAGPYGPSHSKGQWLERIVEHIRSHREELHP